VFIDDINNRYTYLNSMKNIVHEEPTNNPIVPDRQIIVDPNLNPLLDKLMRERPTWRFKTRDRFYSKGGTCYAVRFDIYDGDEELGKLWMEHHWRDNAVRYFFHNPRVSDERQRGGAAFSTKPEVAAKRILKAFHLKTPSERASEAFRMAGESITKSAAEVSWPLRKAKNSIESRLFTYAVNHWDKIKDYVTDDPRLDLPALALASHETQWVQERFNDNRGVVVRIESNGSYLISRRTSEGYTVETKDDSTLSDHMRGALGLLKLMSDGNIIPEVGARAKANLFFVIDKREESNGD
jgi:hypothetical protein